MVFSINFSEEKNQLLKATREICFDDIVSAIADGKLLADKQHPNQKYKHQCIYVVRVGNYAYAVPYVINQQKKEIFLKTIYPSRVLTKRYLKGGKQ
ncbi:toxin [Candidatus Woesebacteria bacterium]|nr:toxin [Candidatus Woesebacteria bacterium]